MDPHAVALCSLKGWKTQLYEGGVRAAAFVHSPLLPTAVHGTRNRKLFHISDVLPTFVSLAGGNTKRNKPLDGFDIWDAVTTSAASPRQELLHNLNPACHRGYVKPNAAIRIGDWKLLVDCFNYTLMAPTGQVSLYNITCE